MPAAVRVKSRSNPITPNRLWLALFLLWTIFLSGLFTPLLKTPGILQALRLNSIYDAKQEEINQKENELIALQNGADLLEKNHIIQQREIRRVLGYAAPDELIFDFSESSATSR